MNPRRPSPTLILSIVALVAAMAGTAFAATQLPKNSVGTKQVKKNAITAAKIKKNAVTTAKVKKEAITSAKIKLGSLATVPSAQVANGLAAMEATHIIGAAGEPPFLNGAKNVPTGELKVQLAGFYKDHDGVVHLQGFVAKGEGSLAPILFALPAGFRPPAGQTEIFMVDEEPVLVFGSNVNLSGQDVSGVVFSPSEAASISGISFRAGS